MRSLVVVMVVVALACSPGTGEPELAFGTDTPADLRELASGVLDQFLTAVPVARACMGQVELEGARSLGDRARYDAAGRRITIRIPATAPQLRASLVHELAHHVEAVCPQHDQLRTAFLKARGLPADAAWFDGDTWEETPSEQLATAFVRVVLDARDPRAPIPLDDAALDVVRGWAEGGR